jgi:hypothetical protein
MIKSFRCPETEKLFNDLPSRSSMTSRFLPAIDWKRCGVIVRASTASESTTSGGYAFVGKTATLPMWR